MVPLLFLGFTHGSSLFDKFPVIVFSFGFLAGVAV